MDLVRVRFRDCSCPGTPHDGQEGRDDGDVAWLRPYLNFEGGAAALRAIQATPKQVVDGRVVVDPAELIQYVGPVYLRYGVKDWNVIDGDGAPVPFDPERALEEMRYEDAYELVDRADDLYGEQALAPLARRIDGFSKRGATATPSRSTSPASSPRRPSRSSRSSSGPGSPSA